MSAKREASARYSDDPETAIPAKADAVIAAVAESAPTTRCRDDPNKANNAMGIRMVYRPVTTGVPAILVYPMTSGIARQAKVTPANISVGSLDFSIGRMP